MSARRPQHLSLHAEVEVPLLGCDDDTGSSVAMGLQACSWVLL